MSITSRDVAPKMFSRLSSTVTGTGYILILSANGSSVPTGIAISSIKRGLILAASECQMAIPVTSAVAGITDPVDRLRK